MAFRQSIRCIIRDTRKKSIERKIKLKKKTKTAQIENVSPLSIFCRRPNVLIGRNVLLVQTHSLLSIFIQYKYIKYKYTNAICMRKYKQQEKWNTQLQYNCMHDTARVHTQSVVYINRTEWLSALEKKYTNGASTQSIKKIGFTKTK